MQENTVLLKEMNSLSDENLRALVKDEQEENAERLQAAWEILDKRGLKDKVLSEIEKEDEKKQLRMDDLIHPENQEEFADDEFAEKVEFLVGSEIHTGERDILGVIKNSRATESKPVSEGMSEHEKQILLRKQKAQLTISGASFLVLVAVAIFQQPSMLKFFLEGGLLFHSLLHLFFSFSTYLSIKSNQ